MMAEPVVHVTPEAHVVIKRFCQERNIRMRTWASDVLMRAVKEAVRPVRRVPGYRLKTNETVAWMSKPFWAPKEKKPKPQEQENGEGTEP